MNSLWSQAGEALRASEEVYLVGYSVPEYDVRAKELLQTKINAKIPIEVCCHSQTDSVTDSLKRLGLLARAAAEPTFERWVTTALR